jgi:hypothetical protein
MPGRNPGSFGGSAAVGFPEDFIKGLQLTYVNTEDVTIGTGRCRDSTNDVDIINRATVTVVIDGGTGVNKLDSGTEAGSTWYAVHICSKGNRGETCGLLSTSAASPTLPTGYTHFRRVGWVYNHSDNDLQAFLQSGKSNQRNYLWQETTTNYIQVLATSSNASGVNVDSSSRIPSTAIKMYWRFTATAGRTGAVQVKPEEATSLTWISLKGDGSQIDRWIGEMPCSSDKGFWYKTYGSGGNTGQLTADCIGWSEVL